MAFKFVLPILLLSLCLLARAMPPGQRNVECLNPLNPDFRNSDEDWMDFPKGDELDEIITRLQDQTNDMPVKKLDDVPQVFDFGEKHGLEYKEKPEIQQDKHRMIESEFDSTETEEDEFEKMDQDFCETPKSSMIHKETVKRSKEKKCTQKTTNISKGKYASPMRGVYFGAEHWRAMGNDGKKRICKYFSVDKYGFEEARQMAMDQRRKYMKEGFSGCGWKLVKNRQPKYGSLGVYKYGNSWITKVYVKSMQKMISKAFAESKFGRTNAEKKAMLARQTIIDNQDLPEDDLRELLSRI